MAFWAQGQPRDSATCGLGRERQKQPQYGVGFSSSKVAGPDLAFVPGTAFLAEYTSDWALVPCDGQAVADPGHHPHPTPFQLAD